MIPEKSAILVNFWKGKICNRTTLGEGYHRSSEGEAHDAAGNSGLPDFRAGAVHLRSD